MTNVHYTHPQKPLFLTQAQKTPSRSHPFIFLHIFQVFWTLKMEQKLDSKALWSLNPSTFQSPKVRTAPTGLWLQFTSTRDPLRKRAMGGEDQSSECQLKPANNSLTCCYVISKEPCEETLIPFHFILWWSYVGAFFENRNMTENMREVYLQTKFQLVLRQNDTTLCSLLWQLHNFRDSPPSNPQIVSNHFKSSEKPDLDLLGCLTRAQLSDLLSVHEQPGLLVILAVTHTFTARSASHEENQVDFAVDEGEDGIFAVHLAVLVHLGHPQAPCGHLHQIGTVVRLLAGLQGEHLEVLRVGVPRFLIFGRNHHVGPQGVRGYDFRFNMKTNTFGTQNPQNRFLHRGPVLGPCLCQNSGAARRSSWSQRPCRRADTVFVTSSAFVTHHTVALTVTRPLFFVLCSRCRIFVTSSAFRSSNGRPWQAADHSAMIFTSWNASWSEIFSQVWQWV